MNAMRMMIAIVWLTGLLPGMAQASDADQFVAASRSQQADMLTTEITRRMPQDCRYCRRCKTKICLPTARNMPLRDAMARWWRWEIPLLQKGKPKPYA